jgi:transposase, IS5 family
MSLVEVPDELWEVVEPLIPVVARRFRHPGRRRLDDRQALNGILYVLHTGIAARGFILPASHASGNPGENRLLPQTAGELDRAGIRPREIVADGGFQPGPTHDAFPDLTPGQIQLSGRHEPGSRRTRKRRARYRTGIEGRISHLKRSYGLRRSRLKGHHGMRTWTGWAILAYDLDTLAIRSR